jgi:hypothetical protein
LRNWGYFLVPIVLVAWSHLGFSAAPPPAVASLLSVGFFMFQARVPCGAINRKRNNITGDIEWCRNNASGILGGCHLKSHRWQNAKLLVSRSTWGQFGRTLLRKANGQPAAINALAASASAVIAVGALVVTAIKLG